MYLFVKLIPICRKLKCNLTHLFFLYLLTKNQRMENGKQVVDGNLEGIKKSIATIYDCEDCSDEWN